MLYILMRLDGGNSTLNGTSNIRPPCTNGCWAIFDVTGVENVDGWRKWGPKVGKLALATQRLTAAILREASFCERFLALGARSIVP